MPEIGDYDPFADPTKPKDDPSGDKGGDDKPKPPDTPITDQQATIDAANKRAADAEARLEERTKSYEQKVEQFTTVLSGRYDQKSQQQEPEPKPKAVDADYDKRPAETVDAVSRAAAKEEVAEVVTQIGQHYGTIIGNLTEQAFEGQMEGLRAERFYEYLKDDVRAFFDQNPENKVSPRAARTIYNQFVGDRINDLLQKEEADRGQKAQDEPAAPRIVRPDVRSEPALRSPAPRGSIPSPADKAVLDDAEQKICDIYTRYGVFEGEEDWSDWKAVLEGRPRKDIPQDYTVAGRQ